MQVSRPSSPRQVCVSLVVAASFILAVSGGLGMPSAAASNPHTRKVSYAPDGSDLMGSYTRDPAVSRNGRTIAYTVYPGSVTTAQGWVAVRDQVTGTTTLLPIFAGGGYADVSANGRYVAYMAGANQAGAGVFVYDTVTGTTTDVSPPQTIWSDPFSENPAISANGRFVSFTYFTWVTPGFAVGQAYLRDLKTGTLTLVSATPTGDPGDAQSGQTDVSANGRFVTFVSAATNLTTRTFVNHVPQIYVRDMWLKKTTLVSVSSVHVKSNRGCFVPSISGDGRYVAFASTATNLSADDTNDGADVFVRDRKTGSTILGSVMPEGFESPDGWEIPGWSPFVDGPGWPQMLSDDGRYLILLGAQGVYLRDLDTGVTTQVDVDDSGTSFSEPGERPSVSGNGRWVVFTITDKSVVWPGIYGYTTNTFIRGPLH
jgi:Tol biopolymer transport system component